MSYSQIKYFWAIFRKAYPAVADSERIEIKNILVRQYTDGRSSSLKDMTRQEIKSLITVMNNLARDRVSAQMMQGDRMRKKVIGLMRSIGYESKGKADMARINGFCQQRGKYKKALNDHSNKELTGLISQIEIIKRKHDQGQKKQPN